MATARKSTASDGDKTINLPQLKRKTISLRIVGETPLITHQFGPEALRKMEEAQGGGAKIKRAARSPEEEFQDSLYHMGSGYGFPASAIKAAMASAGYRYGGEKDKVSIFGAIRIPAALIEIETEAEPTMGRDMVRLANGVASIAYRPYFWPWSAIVPIQFNESFNTLEQIINLVDLAGFHIGIGDWRPEKRGIYGTFTIDKSSITVQ